MTARARTRLLALLACAAIVAAGVALERQHTDPATRQPDQPAAAQPETPSRVSPTPTPTATATATPPAAPGDPAAARVARAYALTATNWSAGTYRAAHRRQTRLAGRRLCRQLERTEPTRVQLEQLARDRETRLAAVLAVRPGRPKTSAQGSVHMLVDVDELRTAAGRRSRQTATYRVDLQREHGAWHVSRFGITEGQP